MAEEDRDKSEVLVGDHHADPWRLPLWERHANLISLGILLALLVIFYFPVWFGGKTFAAPDGVNIRCAVPFVEDAFDRGIYPLWNPYLCGGMPSFASMYMVPRTDWLGMVFKAVNLAVSPLVEPSYFMRLGLNYLMFGGLLFALLRDKKIAAGAALVAAVGLVFSPPVVAFSVFSHTGKLLTAALIPAIFLFSYRLLEKRRLLDFCLLGLLVGFQLLRAHIQICYYTVMMIGLFWLYWVIGEFREKGRPILVLKATGMLAGAGLAGLAMSSFLTLSVWEYSHHSIRGGSGGLGYQLASNWSLHPLEMINFIIPSFTGFGGATYWGPMPFTDFPIYFGLVTLIFAGLALVIRRDKMIWFFAGLFAFSLVVAFGKHLPILYGPMFEYLPLFNKFRVPNMISILMVFSVAVLAGYGVNALGRLAQKSDENRMTAIRNYLLIFGGIVVTLVLILLSSRLAYFNIAAKVGSNAAVAYQMAVSDGLRTLMLFAATSASIMVSIKKPRLAVLMPFVFVALVLVDVWPVNNRYMARQIRPEINLDGYFDETPDVTFLKGQEKPFRIMTVNDSRSGNWYMAHLIENVTGYHAAKLQNYQTLIDRFTFNGAIPKNYVHQTGQAVAIRDPETLTASEVAAQTAFFKMMNIKYLVSPLPLHQFDSSLREVSVPQSQGQNGVFVFDQALPRVWFPREILTIPDQAAILDHMSSGDFDPEITAILEEDLGITVGDVSENSATIDSFDLHRIVVAVDVKSAGLMVFSEVFYPAGWRATVDGQPVEIYKTDFLLRSIWLEPGEHLVEMVFKPRAFTLGLTIGLITLVLLTIGAIFAWLSGKRTLAL